MLRILIGFFVRKFSFVGGTTPLLLQKIPLQIKILREHLPNLCKGSEHSQSDCEHVFYRMQ